MTNLHTAGRIDPDQLLTTEEAARLYRVSPFTLRNWRHAGSGPKFLKVGRRVRYRRLDLEVWLQATNAA